MVALVSCVPYLGTLSAPLVWDDAEFFARGPGIPTPGTVLGIFAQPYWAPGDYLYRPLTVWSFALVHAAQAGPLVQHLVNLLLHAAAGCLLYCLLLRLGCAAGPGLAAALLFAVHPIHTEVVAQIVGRSELLALVFGLAFLLSHVGRRGLPAAVFLLLALWSKESAIAFPALAVWTDVCFAQGRRRFRWLRYAPYAAVAVAWLLIRAAALGPGPVRIPFVDNPLAYASPLVRVATAGWIQLRYLGLLLVPVGLSADYSFREIPSVASLLDPRIFAWIFAAVALGAAVRLAWARRRIVAWAIVGYGILFAATSNLLFPIGTVMAERLAYAPSLFAAAVAAGLLEIAGLGQRRATLAACALPIVLFAGLTAARCRIWTDPEIFARALARSAPASAKAHYTLGIAEQRAGARDAALASLRQAVAIHPGYAEAWSRIGAVSDLADDDAAAVEAYGTAIRIYPDFTEAHYGLALAYQKLGRLAEAADSYRAAIRLDPGLVAAYANLGTVLAEQGRLDEAETMWQRALALDPGHAAARENLERLRALERR